jgi:superfamily II DNA helicase RecQ
VASALLAKIEEAGLVFWENKEIRFTGPSSEIEQQTRSLAGQFETLRTQDGRRLDSLAAYAGISECRAAFLAFYFGEEAGEDCGLCDVCCGRPARPASFFDPLNAPSTPKRRGQRSRRTRKTGSKKARAKKSRTNKIRAVKNDSNPSETKRKPRRRRRR